jgi:predicted ATPase
MSERFVVLSGCSGGGKSTLLAELGRRLAFGRPAQPAQISSIRFWSGSRK